MCMNGCSDKHIILGSASPRRQDLLSGLGIEFETDPRTNFRESLIPDVSPFELPCILSKGKSHGFHRPLNPDEILITADTVVIVGDRVLGKPADREQAFEILRALSGRSHVVVTGVTIRTLTEEKTFSDKTTVTFRELEDDEINYYIDRCSPFDKAGAYGIQEWIGLAGISSIEGSYFNVVGFPAHRVYEELKNFF